MVMESSTRGQMTKSFILKDIKVIAHQMVSLAISTVLIKINKTLKNDLE
jgi:hypothetical protein